MEREQRARKAHSKNKHFLPRPGAKSIWGGCLSPGSHSPGQPLPRFPCSMEQAQGSLAPVPSLCSHPPGVSAEVTQIVISAPSFAHMENTFHNTHQQRRLGRLTAVFIMCFELKSSECKVYYC